MPGTFINNIRGTTAGTPGTGAFTPNGASAGYLAWSTVATGWWGLVRYDDGSSWELTYSYWNGTTLSRASTQLYASSSGSQLTLTSAATAAMVEDALEIAAQLGRHHGIAMAVPSVANFTASGTILGLPGLTATGTAAAATLATTNFLTEQPRLQSTSATTANAQAGFTTATLMGISSSTAGRGGWMFRSRFGGSTLVTGQRMFVGMTSVTQVANTGEPSALASANIAALAKDSTDTNFQFLTKDGTTANKTDTGIAFTANGWYDVLVGSDPGSLTVYFRLVRVDTGAIYYGSKSTNAPVTGSTLMPQCIGGLAATTGTAFVLHTGTMGVVRIF
jgi:hypothetical protein